jgi:hypothetical protein
MLIGWLGWLGAFSYFFFYFFGGFFSVVSQFQPTAFHGIFFSSMAALASFLFPSFRVDVVSFLPQKRIKANANIFLE